MKKITTNLNQEEIKKEEIKKEEIKKEERGRWILNPFNHWEWVDDDEPHLNAFNHWE